MTTADAPYRRPSAVARGWRTFRRWRRGRPFWGAFFTILSGLAYLYSGHITFGGIKVTFVPQEFLGWLIPLLLLLCGVLLLLMPSQRLFYGILAAAVAVGGLVGLNLGGFLLGMILGMVGGSLGASWTPVHLPPADAAPAGPDSDDQSAEDPTVGEDTTLAEDQAPESDVPTPDDRPIWRGPGGVVAMALLVLTVVVGATLVRGPSPASAAPACATAAAAATSPAVPKPSASGTPSASATPTASPKPSASPTPDGGLLKQVVDGVLGVVDGVLGVGDPQPSATPTTASPSSTATPSPSASPSSSAAAPTGTPKPTATRSAPSKASPTPTCAAARALIAPADQTRVATVPAKQITATLEQFQMSYEGVTELSTATGTLQVLEFSMDKSISTPFELQVPAAGGRTLVLGSTQLTVSGNVRFYTTELDGKLLGLPVKFTPDSPPPLPPGLKLPLTLTDVTLWLALVHADTLTAQSLSIAYSA